MKNKIGLFICITAVVTCFSCTNKAPENFGGINLFTFREELKTNPKEVLKSIKEAGYKNIEDAGYADRKFYGMPPTEFKDFLKETGLVPVSSHQGGITYENADATIADVKAVGYEYLVVPIPPMGHFTFDTATKKMGMTGGAENLAKMLDSLGEKCNKAGLKLLYHNHDFEFRKDEQGVVPIDYLLENTNPNVVNFEIDLYWAVKAGADPVKYFEKYPHRFKAWHLKDMDDQGRFAPVGRGKLNFAQFLSKKEQAGMQYYFVEQDMTFDGMKPIDAIKISHETIKKLGYK
jgi:sugar phosphate isomerase/epimerase